MSLLQQTPRFDEADAVRLAREVYGLEATASVLPSERDQNFHLTTARGEHFVLKIANAAEEPAFLEAQNAAMHHVAALQLCPQIVRSVTGAEIARASAGNFIRLLTWIPGRPLATVPVYPASLLEDAGARLGAMARALSDFDHPAIHRTFYWDLARAFDIVDEHSPRIADPDFRSLVQRIAGYVRARDGRALGRLRRAAVHGDANDYNILVDGDDAGPRVTGVIDFGDMVHSYAVAEAAIAMAYAVLGQPDPLDTAATIAGAYHQAHPFTDDELSVLLGLIQLRLCASVSNAADQQRHRPSDEYLSISQAPIRRTLPLLAAIHPDAAEERFRQACGIDRAPAHGTVGADETLRRRRQLLGRNLSVGYRQPLKIVRGWMQYMYDEDGRQYLDAYNNVPHVGHAHPMVVEAVAEQMRAVNTNTRYLHDNLWLLAERLTQTLPDPLRICYFVNSGSEGNELALRLARAHTGARDLIVLDAAYHGNTTTLIDISPYKFNGPGGQGCPDWVHVAAIPDDYRGAFRRGDPAAGKKHADAVGEITQRLRARGARLAGFISETCPSVGGQVIPPSGYLHAVYEHVRAAGGVCIADEVQTALGRMGTHFYAFEAQAVIPDIVVLGKPLGNGYPVAAVVTTRDIARSFDTGMEFFSTFGGSSVSCAAALAVLDVLAREALQAHAWRVGEHLLTGLRSLMDRHESIGDVRGSGLFLGVELVRDRASRTPAGDEASAVANGMRGEGILLGTDGPLHNVLKIRPPMPFTSDDADRLVATLDRVLRNLSSHRAV